MADSNSLALIVPMDQLVNLVVTTLVFALVGIVLFALAFLVIVKIAPFSTRKEIEDDQNVALAILIGSVIIGIALIVAAAVHGELSDKLRFVVDLPDRDRCRNPRQNEVFRAFRRLVALQYFFFICSSLRP